MSSEDASEDYSEEFDHENDMKSPQRAFLSPRDRPAPQDEARVLTSSRSVAHLTPLQQTKKARFQTSGGDPSLRESADLFSALDLDFASTPVSLYCHLSSAFLCAFCLSRCYVEANPHCNYKIGIHRRQERSAAKRKGI